MHEPCARDSHWEVPVHLGSVTCLVYHCCILLLCCSDLWWACDTVKECGRVMVCIVKHHQSPSVKDHPWPFSVFFFVMCHLNRLTLQIHNPLLTSFKCFWWPTLSPFLGKRILRHCDMLWLQRLQFRILDRFSFFAHFEVPHCHHANHRYISDISCSATVP